MTKSGLLANGTLFAFLHGGELIVELPAPRAADLQERNLARPVNGGVYPGNKWVSIADFSLWPELAREAYAGVAEQAVGGES